MYVQYVCIIKGLYTEHIYRCKCICNTKSYYGVYNTYVYILCACIIRIYSYSCVHVCTCVCIHVFEVDIAFSVSHGYWFTASDA